MRLSEKIESLSDFKGQIICLGSVARDEYRYTIDETSKKRVMISDIELALVSILPFINTRHYVDIIHDAISGEYDIKKSEIEVWPLSRLRYHFTNSMILFEAKAAKLGGEKLNLAIEAYKKSKNFSIEQNRILLNRFIDLHEFRKSITDEDKLRKALRKASRDLVMYISMIKGNYLPSHNRRLEWFKGLKNDTYSVFHNCLFEDKMPAFQLLEDINNFILTEISGRLKTNKFFVYGQVEHQFRSLLSRLLMKPVPNFFDSENPFYTDLDKFYLMNKGQKYYSYLQKYPTQHE
ncbi:MAG: hypothetical protein KAI89_06045 [Emcibacter sp.]|nr:hypothetical protein [Emcibacter sp.]